jgi:transcriptional regulator with XRE-family HTH domain
MLGIAQPTVSAWLNGGYPQRRTARVLCEKLEVSEDWLIYGTEPLARDGRAVSEMMRLGIKTPIVFDEAKSIQALASNLKALRDTFPPRRFSEIVGVSKPKVYLRYENGAVPRPVILQRIALRLGVTVSELLSPMSSARIKEVQSQMRTVSDQVVVPPGRVTHRTRLALMQARRQYATPENQKLLQRIFALRTADTTLLIKLRKQLDSCALATPLEIGRYFFPMLLAVDEELSRRAEGEK